MIGILGGTFDPPHNAHVDLAQEALEHLKLEKVLWVVTGDPPHKPDGPAAGVEDRIAMVIAAIREIPGFELSRADLDREPPHYTFGTVEWLREKDPSRQWVYLMGSDSLRDLPMWEQPERFTRNCDLIGVIRRPGVVLDMGELETQVPGIQSKVRFIPSKMYQISGREIRRRVNEGESYQELVPAPVATYIQANNLYQ